MSEKQAIEICRRQEQLCSDRANFESIWQQVGDRVLPGEANFQTKRSAGESRNEKMYDPTAGLALRKYAAIMESLGMPRNQEWHQLKPVDDSLKENYAVKTYMESVNKLLFRLRYAPSANFTAQIGCVRLTNGAFGTAPLFVDQVPGYGLRYKAIPLAEAYPSENHTGVIDTMYRRFQYTARQAMKAFRDKCPEQIKTAYGKNPEQMFWFIHAVRPIDESEGKRLAKGMAYSSCYVSQDYKAVVQDGGYYTFPYPTARDVTSAGEVYGRSPAMWVLPGIKMLNEMKRTILRAAHRAVDPPLLLTEDGALNPFSLRPGALNAGGLDANGNELVKALSTKGDIGLGVDLLTMEQTAINESFYITLFQILAEHPNMTATEVLERASEKAMLLGPVNGREQEFAGQLVERELDLLARVPGLLPPMPDELLEAGGQYKIEFDTPLTRIQKSGDAVGIVRTMEALIPLVNINPGILDVFNQDEIARTLAEVNGMSTKLTMPPEVVAQTRQQRQQQQAAAAAVEAAPKLAGAAKDVGMSA